MTGTRETRVAVFSSNRVLRTVRGAVFIRFDEEPKERLFTRPDSLIFTWGDRYVDRLQAARVVRVRARAYNAGPITVKFDMTGAREAISEVSSRCK